MVDRGAAHALRGKGQHVIPAQPDDAEQGALSGEFREIDWYSRVVRIPHVRSGRQRL